MSDFLHLKIKVIPGASSSQVCGWLEDILKLKINVPPEKGKANREVERLLAETFALPASSIEVIKGKKSPYKTVFVEGVSKKGSLSYLPKKE